MSNMQCYGALVFALTFGFRIMPQNLHMASHARGKPILALGKLQHSIDDASSRAYARLALACYSMSTGKYRMYMYRVTSARCKPRASLKETHFFD